MEAKRSASARLHYGQFSHSLATSQLNTRVRAREIKVFQALLFRFRDVLRRSKNEAQGRKHKIYLFYRDRDLLLRCGITSKARRISQCQVLRSRVCYTGIRAKNINEDTYLAVFHNCSFVLLRATNRHPLSAFCNVYFNLEIQHCTPETAILCHIVFS
jgi:hypothetical protein